MIHPFLHLFFFKWATRSGLPGEITIPSEQISLWGFFLFGWFFNLYFYFKISLRLSEFVGSLWFVILLLSPQKRKVVVTAPLIFTLQSLHFRRWLPSSRGPLMGYGGYSISVGFVGLSVEIMLVNSKELWIVFCWSRGIDHTVRTGGCTS